jgi:hypothetical protein
VYRYVIDEVINQVRGDFEDMGIDESVLQELQRVRYQNYLYKLDTNCDKVLGVKSG